MTSGSSAESVPRRCRRWWVQPYRRADRSEWPCIYFVGVKGRFRYKFFDLSLGWGTRKPKAKTW